MRILVKGGVWKNTEDEILKAAVMKYGKNQWARISSLLTRKTPKQCKARWFEWLDPSIKKTEWSKEEDEKLLHLAKLMPTQWRTIAPIVGRTPSQCLERYQRLLDEAEAKDDNDAGPNADDVRRLRPGEIDPEPESKPARPDPIDMDEDEKEMLSEARARLANTQGKKAKRKAREKQLEEARRLASLQKRRELKAAGIETRVRKKKRGMDYNADIPFHKRAPIGFHDVSDEKDAENEAKKAGVGVLLSKLEGKRRQEVEEEERKRDAKRQKVSKEKGENIPSQAVRDQGLANQISARRPMSLPAPQVGDGEIEELMKMGAAAEAARSVVDADGASASRALLSDYSAMNKLGGVGADGGALRTPRTPAVTDTLRMQARNLRAMEHSQTPLLGDNLSLEGPNALTFEPGTTPSGTQLHTPNPLMAQLTPRGGHGGETPRSVNGGSTPRSGSGGIFGRTPVRDGMGINTPRSEAGFDETPRSAAAGGGPMNRQGLIRQQLSSIWKSLPTPKNEFDIVIPDAPKPAEGEAGDDGRLLLADGMEEDMQDVEARQRAAIKREEEVRMLLRSTPVQRGLPRPLVLQPGVLSDDAEGGDKKTGLSAEEMIKREMERLILRDMIKHPMPGQPPVQKDQYRHVEGLEEDVDAEGAVTLDELRAAQEMISGELETMPEGSRMTDEAFAKELEDEMKAYFFIPPAAPAATGAAGTALNVAPGRFEPAATVTREDVIQSCQRTLQSARDRMRREAQRAQKFEEKLNVRLGGYVRRSAQLRRELAETAGEVQEDAVKLESFRRLKIEEDLACVERVEALRREVARLEQRGMMEQEKYRELAERRQELLEARAAATHGINGNGTTNGGMVQAM
ncbi:CDC5 cell division cycle 5-like protein [Irineochytrium annulatum]|nr:CDC5 cell division cycle 5-like protein [Irineochytrium annulatum]